MAFWNWAVLACLLMLPLMSALWLAIPLWVVPGILTLMSVIVYRMYSHDKQRAIDGGWRVSENALHLAELLGGWPGAFVAQQRLRHKTSKTSYQVVFWCIVFVFQIASADVISGHRLIRWMLHRL